MRQGIALVGCLALLSSSAAEARAQMGIAQGRIVDENDDPVAGATVQFDFQGGIDRHYTTETDEKGKYTQIVPAGRYRVGASKEDYQGGYLEHTVNTGAPTQLPEIQILSRQSLIQEAMQPIVEQFERASELSQAGRLEEAAAIFQELAVEHPEIPEVHLNLGTIYAQQEAWAEAEAEFQKTLELQPENTQAAISLSGVYESQARQEEAAAVMETLAEKHPEDASIHFDLGILYVNIRRAEQALATLQKVEQLDPENVDVHYLLGTLLLNQGQVEQATKHLETYLDRAPEDGRYRGTATDLVTKLKESLQQSQPQ